MKEFPEQRIEQVLENGDPVETSIEKEVNFSEGAGTALYGNSYPEEAEISDEEFIIAGASGAGYATAGFPGPEAIVNGVQAYSQLPQEWQALAAPGAIVAGVLTYQAGKGTLKYIFQ